MTPEQNYRLLQEIDANRRFILQAYQDNPELLAKAEPRIRQLFDTDPLCPFSAVPSVDHERSDF